MYVDKHLKSIVFLLGKYAEEKTGLPLLWPLDLGQMDFGAVIKQLGHPVHELCRHIGDVIVTMRDWEPKYILYSDELGL